jgi:hypothetical protein
MTYRYLVEVDGAPPARRGRMYDGTDAADAMAAWSKAIAEGRLYVTLEALRDGPIVTPQIVSQGD